MGYYYFNTYGIFVFFPLIDIGKNEKTKTKIKLGVTGCLGRMGSKIIKSASSDKNFKIVSFTENKKTNKK